MQFQSKLAEITSRLDELAYTTRSKHRDERAAAYVGYMSAVHLLHVKITSGQFTLDWYNDWLQNEFTTLQATAVLQPGSTAYSTTSGVRTCVLMTSQGHAYATVQRALKTGNAHIALAAAAELRQVGLADALSLVLLIREDNPVLYDKAAARWVSKYAADDRYLLLRDARELIDLLDGAGRHDQGRRRAASSGGCAFAAMRMRPTGWPDVPV
jgi:hypothetical protein